MPTAGELLRLYSLRLEMNDKGLTTWPPALRTAVEGLVGILKALSPAETIQIDAQADRDPVGRFYLAETGELLGEIPNRHFNGPEIT